MSEVSRALVLGRRGVEGLALLWVVALLVVFAWRVGFPLELEWMEGGMLHQARRIQLGQSPYPPPGPEFVPFLYTPLYSAVVAGLGFVFPLGYALGRAVSILAALAIAWAVWTAVRGENKPRAHAALAVGLCCAGYVFTFRWLDVARPDTLFMALVLWALVLLRGSRLRPRRALWAGLLMALAFWTKQTAAPFVIASGLGVLLVAPRRLPIYAGVIAIIDGGGLLLGNALTDGWLWTYVYELHQSHAFNRERFTTKTWGMFVHAWPLVTVVALAVLSRGLGRLPARVRRWRARASEPVAAGDVEAREAFLGGLYWTVLALAGLLASALGYATQWAEPNAFIPGVVLGAVALAVALPVGGRAELAALSVLALQLGLSALIEPKYHPVQQQGLAGLRQSYAWQDPWRTVPRAEVWARAAALRTELERTDGEVLALHRPWWSVLAGGEGHVGSMGVTDVEPDDRAAIERTLRDAVAARRYASIWLEGEPPRWLEHALRRHYRVQQRRHGDERVRPLSGYMSDAGMVTPYRRDQLELVPPGPRPTPPGTTVIADFEGGALAPFEAEGAAFRRPGRGSPRRLPMAGPYGGDWLLGSGGPGGRLELTGYATTPAVELPETGALQMLVGFAGRRARGLFVELVEQGGGGRTVRLPVPGVPHALSTLRWAIDPSWSGAQIRVRLGDESPEALLYFDDLWLVAD
ncbi:MAG: glycosyltransferase 87 family protein [Nannocystaceae bacterium]